MARRVAIREKFNAVIDYLQTIPGVLSAMPSLIGVADMLTGFLRISTAIKPLVYVLSACFIAYIFLDEAGSYMNTKVASPEYSKMRTRALIHLIAGLLLLVLYWSGIPAFEANLPTSLLATKAALFLFAAAVAAAAAELTRALAILGLRICIARRA